MFKNRIWKRIKSYIQLFIRTSSVENLACKTVDLFFGTIKTQEQFQAEFKFSDSYKNIFVYLLLIVCTWSSNVSPLASSSTNKLSLICPLTFLSISSTLSSVSQFANGLQFFFNLAFLSQPLRIAGEGGEHFFNTLLPLPPAAQTLRH